MHGIKRHSVLAIIGAIMGFLGGLASAGAEASGSTRQLAVSGNNAWVDTGIYVSLGDRVAISAGGTISIGCGSCPDRQGPDGQPIARLSGDDRPFVAPGLRLWSLVGRIGSSRPFEIGAEAELVAPRSGLLRLSLNDNSFANNSGEWSVTVSTTRASPQLFVLSPFLLGASDLTNLDLAVILPGLDFSAAQAVGLLADDASTGIVLWETTTKSAVTFTTGNGTTLQSYEADFLTKAPAAGTKKLTVPRSDLISAGGKFYAAALIQAPARGANSSLAKQIVVTASQEGVTDTPAESFLDLKIPPVLLVHGLWGDDHSLDSTRDYLSDHNPWRKDTQLLSRIQYALDLRFDDATTSAIVADAIQSLLAILDSERIVGGRVDVVGHSMGGLVVRHYSSLLLYRAPRDRGQGQFHALTTLDTPELGSALATFLIDHRGDHERAPFFSEAAGVWLALCQSFSVTVAKCFHDNSMPITGPDGRVLGGAVWSLVPGSGPLNHAPAIPTIAGIVWADITSVVRAKDDSVLRYVISNLIKAIYSDPDSAPSPTDILGGPNDVIVDFASQAEGSTDANRIKFLGLDHSALNFEGFDITNAVNSSNKVNESVACWLKTDGDPSCIPLGPVPGAVEAALATAMTIPKVSDHLVQLPRVLDVGVRVAIRATVAAKGVSRVAVFQRNDAGKSASPSAGRAIPFRVAGNGLSFEIIPQLPGRVRFDIEVTLSDGSKLVQRVIRNVSIREDMLEEFHAHRQARAFLFMQIGGRLPLSPYGVFRNVAEDVPLSGQVQYSVESAENPPVVRIEGDSLVPLRPGTARVLARLGSRSDILKVTVKP